MVVRGKNFAGNNEQFVNFIRRLNPTRKPGEIRVKLPIKVLIIFCVNIIVKLLTNLLLCSIMTLNFKFTGIVYLPKFSFPSYLDTLYRTHAQCARFWVNTKR